MVDTRKFLVLLLALWSLVFYSMNAQSTAGKKEPFKIKRADCELTVGGKIKVESYFEDNAYLLNKNIPDENEYFKETIDLTLAAAYGQEKYGYKAAEFFADLRHKSVWGLALSYADRDSGPIAPSNVKFSDSSIEAIFGSHSHTSGKPLIWFKDAWMRFSLNAVAGCKGERLHFLKLGWFPFDMGRGIAFGGFYGLNKELLGLYSYVEDKAAPGINLHGTLIKDRLEYDVYYSKFEERSKNFAATINLEKRHIIGRSGSPWRGINKDDEVIAGRLIWQALKSNKFGDLELEPYVFYNAASDQKVEKDSSFGPDAKFNWGSYGLALEHSYGNFEWGAEVAFNYGKEKLFNIDRNKSFIDNRNGQLVEVYSHIYASDPTIPGAMKALVIPTTKSAARQPTQGQPEDNGKQIVNADGVPTGFFSGTDRFRPAYDNKFDGWMAVIDGAYTFENWNLKLALAYGYASGDDAPHTVEKNKKYHGFVGLHELYSGQRVTSILILDQRLLMRPTSVAGEAGKVSAAQDSSFSDLQHVGVGATWTPRCRIRDLSLNPNIVAFWKAHEINKFIASGSRLDPVEKARTYMGTELNLLAKCSLMKDLTLFANLATFIPGGFFTDMKGVPVGKDIFNIIIQDDRNDIEDASMFRLSDDTAYHMNIGLEFKF